MTPPRLAEDAKEGPLLVFIHGTASSTTGSFGALQKVSADDWQSLGSRFGRSDLRLRASQLLGEPDRKRHRARPSCPARAELDLVTHSRGGLVGDLLCLENIADDLIDGYKSDLPEPGDVADDERERIKSELANAHAAERDLLRELRALLQQKQFVIRRYVRVAAPARGTLLASGNLDIFLSALLTLIGRVPYLYGNPLYYAFKRVVIEIAKNRTDAKLDSGYRGDVAGFADGALFGRCANRNSPRKWPLSPATSKAAVCSKGWGCCLPTMLFFSGIDNDLVVDTDSMYAGIARRLADARCSIKDRRRRISLFSK